MRGEYGDVDMKKFSTNWISEILEPSKETYDYDLPVLNF